MFGVKSGYFIIPPVEVCKMLQFKKEEGSFRHQSLEQQ